MKVKQCITQLPEFLRHGDVVAGLDERPEERGPGQHHIAQTVFVGLHACMVCESKTTE